jgi:hypothetical protein
MEEADELAARTSKSTPRRLMTPRKAKKLRWVGRLTSIMEDVILPLDPISEDFGLMQEATTALSRVTC